MCSYLSARPKLNYVLLQNAHRQQVLSGSGASNTIQIPPEDAQDAQLSAADLRKLAGEAAVTAAVEAPRERPGSPVPMTGVAFLLAGAGGIPGGSTLVRCP